MGDPRLPRPPRAPAWPHPRPGRWRRQRFAEPGPPPTHRRVRRGLGLRRLLRSAPRSVSGRASRVPGRLRDERPDWALQRRERPFRMAPGRLGGIFGCRRRPLGRRFRRARGSFRLGIALRRNRILRVGAGLLRGWGTRRCQDRICRPGAGPGRQAWELPRNASGTAVWRGPETSGHAACTAAPDARGCPTPLSPPPPCATPLSPPPPLSLAPPLSAARPYRSRRPCRGTTLVAPAALVAPATLSAAPPLSLPPPLSPPPPLSAAPPLSLPPPLSPPPPLNLPSAWRRRQAPIPRANPGADSRAAVTAPPAPATPPAPLISAPPSAPARTRHRCQPGPPRRFRPHQPPAPLETGFTASRGLTSRCAVRAWGSARRSRLEWSDDHGGPSSAGRRGRLLPLSPFRRYARSFGPSTSPGAPSCAWRRSTGSRCNGRATAEERLAQDSGSS